MTINTNGNAEQNKAAKQELPQDSCPGAPRTYWESVNQSTWGRYLREVEEQAVRRAIQAAGRYGTAMEVGCDGGRWAGLLVKNGWTVICTDTQKEALELTTERVPQARCVLVRPEDTTLPGQSGTIDLVLCIEVDSVSSEEWFIREAARVLKPGGVLVATVLNRHSLRAMIHVVTFAKRARRGFFGWYRIGYSTWRSMLLRSRLNPIQEHGFCWAPYSRTSNSRLIPSMVRGERLLALNRLPRISPWVAVVAQKS
jgi:SAM-dependent methyltransferase